jgi:allophanate hydrolase
VTKQATLPARFEFASLRQSIAEGASASDIVREAYRRIAARGDDHVWIHLPSLDQALASAAETEARWREAGQSFDAMPLYGLPFAVKDNIDVAWMQTTAACPAFAYMPERSARVVERLGAAGAIPIGKTNLDQFATGLVGVRSPYGAVESVFGQGLVSGGSSSGSSVAVANGSVAFSLGTDTAGSGRVPAMFNNIVGLKPTLGLISTRGVLPACQSLDSVSIFALSVADASAALGVAAGYDEADPYSRHQPAIDDAGKPARIGVPRSGQLDWLGNSDAAALYDGAIARLATAGHAIVEFDFAPFKETAALLYEGPWVAERVEAIRDFFAANPDALHPVTRAIYDKAATLTAVDAFRGFHRLEALRRRTQREWTRMDALVLPTAATQYTIAEVEADPIRLNSNLGLYTNFVNLLDLAALAIPAGFQPNGRPFGVTLMAQAFQDARLARLADGLVTAPTGKF